MPKTAALSLLIFLMLGCSSAPPGASPEGSTSASGSLPPRSSGSGDLAPTVPPSAAPIIGEVPPGVMDAVRARLATDTGLDAAAAEVKVAEAVEWPDGSLGCPEPGGIYTQAIVPGYRVVLVLDGQEYDYRVAARNVVIRRCEDVGPIGG